MPFIASNVLPVIVKGSGWKDLLSLVGSLIVTGMGGYALADQGASWITEAVTMIFAVGAIHFGIQPFNRKPRLVISEDGINVDYWNSALMSLE